MMKEIKVIYPKDNNIVFKQTVRSLKSLTDYNEEKKKLLANFEKVKHLTGLSCPECLKQDKEVELHYPDPDWVTLGIPPKYDVLCPECNYRGYKIA